LLTATGHEVHLAATANVYEVGGTSGLASASASGEGGAGEVRAAAAVIGAGLALATGSITATLLGDETSVAAVGGAGTLAHTPAGVPATTAIETALTADDLAAITTGHSAIASAFAIDLEATAASYFSAVHGDEAGEQTVTAALEIQLSTFQLALGDGTFGLFGGDAVGDGFDTMHFSISAGTADAVTLVEADFSTDQEAEAFFSDHAFSFGDLGQYQEFGTLTLRVEVTTTGTEAGGGFEGGILFADVGDGSGEDPAPVFALDAFGATPHQPLEAVHLALA
jgi:hypothetical protein